MARALGLRYLGAEAAGRPVVPRADPSVPPLPLLPDALSTAAAAAAGTAVTYGAPGGGRRR